MNNSDTRTRILDAAEKLFAQHGYDGASLRAITSAAGVNLAAVNYHFRSKEALLGAVLGRRFRHVNRERLRLLEASESSPKRAPHLEQLVEALFRPAFRLGKDAGEEGAMVRKLMGRMLSDPGVQIRRVLEGEFYEVATRFASAFRRALPEVPAEELYWRIHFSMGAMSATLLGAPFLEIVSKGKCDPTDVDSALRRITRFVSSGLRAPVNRSSSGLGKKPGPGRNLAATPREKRGKG